MRKLTTLDNGLRIVTHHMASVKSVSFGAFINVGSRDETEEINGTAHFLEHMAFKGTKSRSAKEIGTVLLFAKDVGKLSKIRIKLKLIILLQIIINVIS